MTPGADPALRFQPSISQEVSEGKAQPWEIPDGRQALAAAAGDGDGRQPASEITVSSCLRGKIWSCMQPDRGFSHPGPEALWPHSWLEQEKVIN